MHHQTRLHLFARNEEKDMPDESKDSNENRTFLVLVVLFHFGMKRKKFCCETK